MPRSTDKGTPHTPSTLDFLSGLTEANMTLKEAKKMGKKEFVAHYSSIRSFAEAVGLKVPSAAFDSVSGIDNFKAGTCKKMTTFALVCVLEKEGIIQGPGMSQYVTTSTQMKNLQEKASIRWNSPSSPVESSIEVTPKTGAIQGTCDEGLSFLCDDNRFIEASQDIPILEGRYPTMSEEEDDQTDCTDDMIQNEPYQNIDQFASTKPTHLTLTPSSLSLAPTGTFQMPIADVTLAHPVFSVLPTPDMFKEIGGSGIFAELENTDIAVVSLALPPLVHQKYRHLFVNTLHSAPYQKYIINSLTVSDLTATYGTEGYFKTMHQLSMFIGAMEMKIEIEETPLTQQEPRLSDILSAIQKTYSSISRVEAIVSKPGTKDTSYGPGMLSSRLDILESHLNSLKTVSPGPSPAPPSGPAPLVVPNYPPQPSSITGSSVSSSVQFPPAPMSSVSTPLQRPFTFPPAPVSIVPAPTPGVDMFRSMFAGGPTSLPQHVSPFQLQYTGGPPGVPASLSAPLSSLEDTSNPVDFDF